MWQLFLLAIAPCLSQPSFDNLISLCKPSEDPNSDCIGAYFVETDGKRQSCNEHKDCYDYREPIHWCRPDPEQKWMKEGCHCDPRLQLCIINRQSYGRLEYTHCRSALDWHCP